VGLEDERRALRERRSFDALIHHIARKKAERIVKQFVKEKAPPQKSSADAPSCEGGGAPADEMEVGGGAIVVMGYGSFSILVALLIGESE
jgi:hypothetical protein